jgi:DNA-binding NarL/FixJ family response regulator
MFAYLILRDNKQWGPFSLEELKSFGIQSTDLLWIEGRSTGWRFPDEIEEIQAFVHVSPINSRLMSNTSIDIEHKEDGDGKFRYGNKPEKSSFLPAERKLKPSEEQDPEKDRVSKRSLEIRKNILAKKDAESQETNPRNFASADIIKVIIADDHRLFREGVKTALGQKSDIKILGEAENGMQLLNLLKHSKPDVILLDIQMPVMDGISALTSIRKLYADMKVIILSMHEGHSMVSTLMETGANGYLTKTADPETIYNAIKTCHEKNYFFNELTNVSMLEGLRSKKRIPEKINTNVFDGADLMMKLAAAQKKVNTHSYSSLKSQKRNLFAIFSILLIGAGVVAGITMMGRSTKQTLPAASKKNPSIPASSSPQPATVKPLQSVASSKRQSDDSLQKKIDAEMLSEEKKYLLRDKKNEALEKHTAKKIKDSLRSQAQGVAQKKDSSGSTVNTAPARQIVSAADELKAAARSSIHNLVTASVNDYHKGAFGGLSEIEITVNNRSTYTIDEVTVEVQYILANSKLHKTETLNFQNIQPASSKMLQAPKSSRGAKIEYKVISIKSKELEL